MEVRRNIEELQSLRGLAALNVVISHVSTVYTLPPNIRLTIDFLFNAHSSIVIFFVLSGYVLAGSLTRRRANNTSYASYYVARAFRLLPALWAASFISLMLIYIFPPTAIYPVASSWFLGYIHGVPSLTIGLLCFFGLSNWLLMPVWTVFIEFLGSSLMPFMVVFALRYSRCFSLLLVALGLVSFPTAHLPHRLNIFAYLFEFAVGIQLASYDFGRKRKYHSAWVSVSAGALLFFRPLWFFFMTGSAKPLTYGYEDPLPMLVEGLAAAALIGLIVGGYGRSSVLSNRVAVRLGNISYSLYLLHFPIAILATKLLSQMYREPIGTSAATAILLLATISASLFFATIQYHCIEIPMNNFGRSLFPRRSAERRAVIS